MKYLSEYTEENTSKLIEDCGAFFAFSNSQLDEQKNEGVTYKSMGAGLICPADNCKRLHEGLKLVNDNGIKQDIEENGMTAIIKRELNNHESFYTGDTESCIDSLRGYGFSDEQVNEVYYSMSNNVTW